MLHQLMLRELCCLTDPAATPARTREMGIGAWGGWGEGGVRVFRETFLACYVEEFR